MVIGFLRELESEGVRIFLEDGRLKYAGPKDSLTPEKISQLKDLKPQIVSLLSDEPWIFEVYPGETVQAYPMRELCKRMGYCLWASEQDCELYNPSWLQGWCVAGVSSREKH